MDPRDQNYIFSLYIQVYGAVLSDHTIYICLTTVTTQWLHKFICVVSTFLK